MDVFYITLRLDGFSFLCPFSNNFASDFCYSLTCELFYYSAQSKDINHLIYQCLHLLQSLNFLISSCTIKFGWQGKVQL